MVTFLSLKNVFQFIKIAKVEDNTIIVPNVSEKSDKEMIINAGIMAGLGFFATYIAVMGSGLAADPVQTCIASFLASGLQFFTSLAVQRGLKK